MHSQRDAEDTHKEFSFSEAAAVAAEERKRRREWKRKRV